MSQMQAAIFNVKMLEIVKAIAEAEDEYQRCIRAWALAEKNYKRREAKAFLHIDDAKNVREREAKAETLEFQDKQTLTDLRYEAHLAQGLMDAAKGAHRARMAELSALQSEANLAKEEARFARTGPGVDP